MYDGVQAHKRDGKLQSSMRSKRGMEWQVRYSFSFGFHHSSKIADEEVAEPGSETRCALVSGKVVSALLIGE